MNFVDKIHPSDDRISCIEVRNKCECVRSFSFLIQNVAVSYINNFIEVNVCIEHTFQSVRNLSIDLRRIHIK